MQALCVTCTEERFYTGSSGTDGSRPVAAYNATAGTEAISKEMVVTSLCLSKLAGAWEVQWGCMPHLLKAYLMQYCSLLQCLDMLRD